MFEDKRPIREDIAIQRVMKHAGASEADATRLVKMLPRDPARGLLVRTVEGLINRCLDSVAATNKAANSFNDGTVGATDIAALVEEENKKEEEFKITASAQEFVRMLADYIKSGYGWTPDRELLVAATKAVGLPRDKAYIRDHLHRAVAVLKSLRREREVAAVKKSLGDCLTLPESARGDAIRVGLIDLED